MPSRKSGGNSRLRKVYRKVFPEYKIIDPAKNGDFAANLAEKKHGIGRTHLLKHTIRDGGGSTVLYHFYKPTSPTRPSDLEQAPWKLQGAPGPPSTSASAVMYYVICILKLYHILDIFLVQLKFEYYCNYNLLVHFSIVYCSWPPLG